MTKRFSASKLKHQMAIRHVTPFMLAMFSGVSLTSIYKFRQGSRSNPLASTVAKLAAALKVRGDELME